jgi:hypothetical protein
VIPGTCARTMLHFSKSYLGINFVLLNDTDTSCLAPINLCLLVGDSTNAISTHVGFSTEIFEWRMTSLIAAATEEVDFRNITQSCPNYFGRVKQQKLSRTLHSINSAAKFQSLPKSRQVSNPSFSSRTTPPSYPFAQQFATSQLLLLQLKASC